MKQVQLQRTPGTSTETSRTAFKSPRVGYQSNQILSALNSVDLVGLSWVFRWSKFFLAGIFWVQIFSRGCFVGPRFSLVSILWVQDFMIFNQFSKKQKETYDEH